MNYCIIADFFQEDLCRGAELNVSALIELLRKNHKITTRRSHTVTPDFINNNDYIWIVSNRMNLSEATKEALKNTVYYVHENDAGWLKTRDFGLYEDFIPPVEDIINKEFYEKARKVVMQSKVHQHAIKQALGLTNTISANGNCWSQVDLNLLRALNTSNKLEEYVVLGHSHPTKGTSQAVKFCEDNSFNFTLLPEMPRSQYLTELVKYKTLVFFPQVFESYGRVAAEFAALGGSIVTNNKLAFRYEDHASLRGHDLIDFMENNNKDIVKIFE